MARKSPNEGSLELHISEDLLSAYIDSMATEEERARVDGHLAVCQECSQNLLTYQQVVALVQGLPRVPLPRAFTLSEEQVGIRSARSRAPWIVTYLRAAAVMAAIMLVVLAGGEFLLLSSVPQTAQPDAVALRSGQPPAAALPAPSMKSPNEEPPQAGSDTPESEMSQPEAAPAEMQIEKAMPAVDESVSGEPDKMTTVPEQLPEGRTGEPIAEPVGTGGGGAPTGEGESSAMGESGESMMLTSPVEEAPLAPATEDAQPAPAPMQPAESESATAPAVEQEDSEVPPVAAAAAQAPMAMPQESAVEAPGATATPASVALIPLASPTLAPSPLPASTPMPGVVQPPGESISLPEEEASGEELTSSTSLVQWLERWRGPLRVAEVALGALVVVLIATTWVAGRKS